MAKEKASSESVTEQGKLSFLHQILKVIYAPHKAFKEIMQNPKLKGPLLIMLLFTAVYSASAYVYLSKTYNEQVFPAFSRGDEWTENSTLWTWTSNAQVTESDDHIGGGYCGNKSIQFSAINETQVYMQLANIGPVNCSGAEGYKSMSFRVKLASPGVTELENASVYLFSNQANFFYYNLTQQLGQLNSTVWNNLTIALGPKSDWTNSTVNADWSSITSLGFEFTLPEKTNMTIHLDGLFFRGVFILALDNLTANILPISLRALTQFVTRWIIIAALLFIMIRGFGTKTAWQPILVLVGFVLITMLIEGVIDAAAFATLPKMFYPFELASGIPGEAQVAYNTLAADTWLVSQIFRYAQIAIIIWTVLLCSVALRKSTELSLTKSALISTVAFFVSMLAESFILGY
jgi:hypothetical protein